MCKWKNIGLIWQVRLESGAQMRLYKSVSLLFNTLFRAGISLSQIFPWDSGKFQAYSFCSLSPLIQSFQYKSQMAFD